MARFYWMEEVVRTLRRLLFAELAVDRRERRMRPFGRDGEYVPIGQPWLPDVVWEHPVCWTMVIKQVILPLSGTLGSPGALTCGVSIAGGALGLSDAHCLKIVRADAPQGKKRRVFL